MDLIVYKYLRYSSIFMATLLACGNVHAERLSIPQDTLTDLTQQRALLGDIVRKLDETSRKISAVKSDMEASDQSIALLEAERKRAKANLEKKQAYDRDNPGEIVEQLRMAEDRNKNAARAVEDAKAKRSKSESDLIALNKQADGQYSEFLKQQKSFEREIDRVVDVTLQDRLKALQVSKTVEATESVPCGDDPIPVCKERSKKAAELKASEQGSIVVINSMTEVKNFKLTKEELRSEVSATLSNKTYFNQHLIGETAYETSIRATVEPAIGDTLRDQMADNIRADIYSMVGGRIDYTQVQNPGDVAQDAAPAKRAAQRKTSKAPQQVPEEAPAAAPPREEATREEAPKEDAPKPKVRKLEKPIFSF